MVSWAFPIKSKLVTAAATAVWLVLASASAQADGFKTEAIRIPAAFGDGKKASLEALVVRSDDATARPLALVTHGAPRDPKERTQRAPTGYQAQAIEFARRGYVAVVVMRRGYGQSDGPYAESNGACENPDYVRAGRASAEDLRQAAAFLVKQPGVKPTGMIAVGVSAGGLATVALTADPPPGLVAGISFAGGRGSTADDQVCKPEALAQAFATFGQKSRLPMLWVYAENDHYFSPKLAKSFLAAFDGAGGKAELVVMPPIGQDGHTLFSSGVPTWTPVVDKFLAANNLVNGPILAAPKPADLPVPKTLSADSRPKFNDYLVASGHKAFAVSDSGAWGWRSGRRTIDEARTEALAACQKNSSKPCRVYATDDKLN